MSSGWEENELLCNNICILSWLLMGLVLGKQYMHFFDRYWGWYNTPVFVGLIYLEFRRTLHQKYNLIAVGNAKIMSRSKPIQQLDALRCVSGKYNITTAGGPTDSDTFFGRNMMPQVQTEKVSYHMTSNNTQAHNVCIFASVKIPAPSLDAIFLWKFSWCLPTQNPSYIY